MDIPHSIKSDTVRRGFESCRRDWLRGHSHESRKRTSTTWRSTQCFHSGLWSCSNMSGSRLLSPSSPTMSREFTVGHPRCSSAPYEADPSMSSCPQGRATLRFAHTKYSGAVSTTMPDSLSRAFSDERKGISCTERLLDLYRWYLR